MNSTILLVAAQIFGVITFLLSFMSTKSETRKKIFFYNTIGNFVCAVQYLCLIPTKSSAITGAICSFLAGLRNFIFIKYEKVPLSIVFTYITILTCINLPFVDNFLDIVPVINVALTAYALSQNNVFEIKLFALYTGLATLTYDILTFAFVGAFTDIVSVLTVIFVLFDLIKKNKQTDLNVINRKELVNT